MCALTQEQLEKYIFSCGLYKTKAEHILSASRDISEHFGGKVPDNIKDLMSLAGRGQKDCQRGVLRGVRRRRHRRGYARVPRQQPSGAGKRQDSRGSGRGPSSFDSQIRLVEGASLADLSRSAGLSFPASRLRRLYARPRIAIFSKKNRKRRKRRKKAPIERFL